MNKQIIALVIWLASYCYAQDSTVQQTEEDFRSDHISNLLSLQDASDAIELYSYYEKQVFRPEAAYYWANVAFKMNSSTITVEKLHALEAKIHQTAFTNNEIALMPETLRNPSFQKKRAAFIQNLEKDKLNSLANLKSLFMLDLGFAEEAFYWFSKENDITKDTNNSSPLKTLQRSIYISRVSESSQFIITGQIESESSFWRRLKIEP